MIRDHADLHVRQTLENSNAHSLSTGQSVPGPRSSLTRLVQHGNAARTPQLMCAMPRCNCEKLGCGTACWHEILNAAVREAQIRRDTAIVIFRKHGNCHQHAGAQSIVVLERVRLCILGYPPQPQLVRVIPPQHVLDERARHVDVDLRRTTGTGGLATCQSIRPAKTSAQHANATSEMQVG